MYYEQANESENTLNIKPQEELEDDGELEKTTIVLDYNEYVTQIDMYKTDNNILQEVIIHVGNKHTDSE